MKISEAFEGENSSLRKAFDEAVEREKLTEYLQWLASPEAEVLSDGVRLTAFCRTVNKLY